MSSCLLSVSPLSSSPITFLPSTSPSRSSSSTQIPYTFLKRRGELTSRIWASPNESQGKRRSNDGIKMVDPLEAKRLAAKQLQEIQAKEKLRRQRRIEAINGAWAMIGLTAGLVVEGQTGKSILTQLSGYLNAVFSFFSR